MTRPYRRTVPIVVLLIAAGLPSVASEPAQAATCEYWVAPPPAGNDSHSGTSSAPWATMTHASTAVPDAGCTVWFRDGTYQGGQEVERRFASMTTFRAVNPYRAKFRSNGTVVDVDGARNITLQGFDIAHTGSGASGYVVLVNPGNGVPAEDVTIRDNIIHDSWDNDLLKIHDGSRLVTVDGNIFYNQGPSEQHLDINSVTDVVIQNNILFNDFARTGRPSGDTKHFIIIKDSNEGSDGLLGSRRITVRRNVFLNWQGAKEQFIKVGNDGNADFEARDVKVDANLFVGNSSTVIGSVFAVAGARDIAFVNNTVVGDMPSHAYAIRLERKGSNPRNENIQLHNNVWSDPTGTMGTDGPGDSPSFSSGDDQSTVGLSMSNNLYWNGGRAVPTGDVVSPSEDPRRVVADPGLAVSAVSLPVWSGGAFASGAATIRQEFIRLAQTYALPSGASPVVDAADPAWSTAKDLLGRARGTTPSIGAMEPGSVDPGAPSGSSVAVLRLAGSDRFATSVAASADVFRPGIEVAYVASGATYPDALAAGAAAGHVGAPVLLVGKDVVPQLVIGELARLDPDVIVVVGGRAVVSDSVVQRLGAIAPVRRLGGGDRYDTASLVALDAFDGPVPVAFVATGVNYPDALSGAAAAGASGGPLLLTQPDRLPSSTRSALDRLKPKTIIVLGGSAAVSEGVVAELSSIAATTRVAGSDRFSTAAAVARRFFPSTTEVAYVVTARSFPDALSAAGPAGYQGSPVLLTDQATVPAALRAELIRLAPEVVKVLGGRAAVDDSVVNEIRFLLD